jgi:hypothetical protein
VHTADQVKREYSKPRLLALAAEEQLELSRDGRMQCPLRCSEDKRGASVSEDPAGHAVWHCQRCNAGGSAIDLIVATRQLDVAAAIELLAARIPHLTPIAAAAKKPRRPPAAELWRALEAHDQQGFDYLRGRGLEAAVALGAVRFSVGTSSYPWLNHRAIDGFRVVMPLWTPRGDLAQLHLRNVCRPSRSPSTRPPASPGRTRSSSRRTATRTRPSSSSAPSGPRAPPTASSSPRAWRTRSRSPSPASSSSARQAPTRSRSCRPSSATSSAGRSSSAPQNDAARVAAGAKVKLTSEDAFLTLEQQLTAAGAEVLRLVTPAPHKDPAEWCKAIGVEKFKLELAKLQASPELEVQPQAAGNGALKVLQMPARDPRPRIIVSTEEHEVNDQALAAIADDQVIYQRDGMLVHVVRDASAAAETDLKKVRRETNAPRIAPLPAPILRERLTARARWVKVLKTKGKVVPEHPPAWTVSALHARGNWRGVRWLAGLVEAPVLRSDGSVLETPGYDPASGLLFEPSARSSPCPCTPRRADAFKAAELLLDVVGDFPFAASMHRSAWLAALLTPLAATRSRTTRRSSSSTAIHRGSAARASSPTSSR